MKLDYISTELILETPIITLSGNIITDPHVTRMEHNDGDIFIYGYSNKFDDMETLYTRLNNQWYQTIDVDYDFIVECEIPDLEIMYQKLFNNNKNVKPYLK